MAKNKPNNKLDIKPVEKKLADGPLASEEAGRAPKTEKPIVALNKEEKVADDNAEAKMFKAIAEDAKARGKVAEMDPINGTIIIK